MESCCKEKFLRTNRRKARLRVKSLTCSELQNSFEFIGGIAQFSNVGQTVHLPPALAQPIAADGIASALAEITLSAPANGMIEIAGPERGRALRAAGRCPCGPFDRELFDLLR
jgi:hypothetical protein